MNDRRTAWTYQRGSLARPEKRNSEKSARTRTAALHILILPPNSFLFGRGLEASEIMPMANKVPAWFWDVSYSLPMWFGWMSESLGRLPSVQTSRWYSHSFEAQKINSPSKSKKLLAQWRLLWQKRVGCHNGMELKLFLELRKSISSLLALFEFGHFCIGWYLPKRISSSSYFFYILFI